MKCSNCQADNDTSAKFCAKCGQSLQPTATPSPSSTPTPPPQKKSITSVEDLFRKTWQLYQKSWLNLLLISLITVATWKVWGLIVMPAIFALFGLGTIATGNLQTAIGVGLMGLAVLILSWVVVFEIGFWGSAAMIVALEASSKGQNPKLGDIYNTAKKLLWPLSVVSLLVFLVVGTGFLFLIIPGLILAFLFQFVSFVVVAEGKTGTAVLSRSKELVWPNFLGILGRNLLMLLVIGLVNIVFSRMLFFSIVSQVIILPFALTYHYLIYKDTVA